MLRVIRTVSGGLLLGPAAVPASMHMIGVVEVIVLLLVSGRLAMVPSPIALSAADEGTTPRGIPVGDWIQIIPT